MYSTVPPLRVYINLSVKQRSVEEMETCMSLEVHIQYINEEANENEAYDYQT